MTHGVESEGREERLPGPELLDHLLPHFASIMVLGRSAMLVGALLKRRTAAHVALVGAPREELPLAGDHVDEVADTPAQLGTRTWDAVLLCQPDIGILRLFLHEVPPNDLAYLYVLVRGGEPQRSTALKEIPPVLQEGGFGVYTHWVDEASGDVVVLMISTRYNPVAHARTLFDAGHPGFAYRVLQLVPEAYRGDADTTALLESEMQLCHLAWVRNRPPEDAGKHFAQAQTHFYAAVSAVPLHAPSYQCHAEYWRMLGDHEIGARLLRSLLHVREDEGARRQYASLGTLPAPRPQVSPTPPVAPKDYRPRILYLLNQRPHFGLDVLYDGLCRVLGSDRVVDFPEKDSLHGGETQRLKNYPCRSNWPHHGYTREQVLDELRAGAFDVVLFGDCECSLPPEIVQGVLDAGGDTPLYVVDALDEATDARLWLKDYLGEGNIAGYFKREMLACIDYGVDAFPLPFACPDHLVPDRLPEERSVPVFWAGHRQFGLRRLYLERLEQQFGWDMNASFEPDAYFAQLRDSRIGINIYGYGFDTVRFWELPAHGCLLLSERLPIHIPYPFVHGETAVLFNDLPELETLLQHYLADEEETRRIAEAGHAHLKAHHTGTARARQLLGWLHAHGA